MTKLYRARTATLQFGIKNKTWTEKGNIDTENLAGHGERELHIICILMRERHPSGPSCSFVRAEAYVTAS